MNVEISYHAQVRLAAGRASEPVEMAAGATLSTLLAALADRYAPAFRQFVVNNTNRPRPVPIRRWRRATASLSSVLWQVVEERSWHS